MRAYIAITLLALVAVVVVQGDWDGGPLGDAVYKAEELIEDVIDDVAIGGLDGHGGGKNDDGCTDIPIVNSTDTTTDSGEN